MRNRIILCIDMDAFFTAIEERENPRFKGKPVVVGANPKEGRGRGVVSTANYEARKYGIHSALPISIAWRKCPSAVFLPVNTLLYQKVSENIMRIVKKYSPLWEIVSVDEAYLDLTFLKNYKRAEIAAKKLRKEILDKEKLTATVGIGPNKLISKMASEKAKPDGLLLIQPASVQRFLDPLDIQKLPGIGSKTAEKLQGIKINNVRELRKVSVELLKGMFGVVGERIYEKAKGIDQIPVVSEHETKSIGKEHTFEQDTRDSKEIFDIFEELIEEVFEEIRENGFSFKTITVVCRFSGFETHTKAKTLKEYTQNSEILRKVAKNLLLRFMVENSKSIRLVGVRVSSLK